MVLWYILTVIGWIYKATNITRGSYMHARSQKKRIFRSQQQNLRKFMGIWTTLLESAADSRELSKAWASSSLLFEWPWKLALYKPLQELYLFFWWRVSRDASTVFFIGCQNTKKRVSSLIPGMLVVSLNIYIYNISIQWPDMTTISASKRGPQLGSLGSIAPLLWLKGDDSSLGWTYVVY